MLFSICRRSKFRIRNRGHGTNRRQRSKEQCYCDLIITNPCFRKRLGIQASREHWKYQVKDVLFWSTSFKTREICCFPFVDDPSFALQIEGLDQIEGEDRRNSASAISLSQVKYHDETKSAVSAASVLPASEISLDTVSRPRSGSQDGGGGMLHMSSSRRSDGGRQGAHGVLFSRLRSMYRYEPLFT